MSAKENAVEALLKVADHIHGVGLTRDEALRLVEAVEPIFREDQERRIRTKFTLIPLAHKSPRPPTRKAIDT